MDSTCDVEGTMEGFLSEASGFDPTGAIEVVAFWEPTGPDELEGELRAHWDQLVPDIGTCTNESINLLLVRADSYEQRLFVAELQGDGVAEATPILVRISLIDGRWLVTGAGF